MGSSAACAHIFSASCSFPSLRTVSSDSTQIFSKFPLVLSRNADLYFRNRSFRIPTPVIRAALDGTNQETSTPVFVEEEEEDKQQPSEVCFTYIKSYVCCWIFYIFLIYIHMIFKHNNVYISSGQQVVLQHFSRLQNRHSKHVFCQVCCSLISNISHAFCLLLWNKQELIGIHIPEVLD